jgi:hypothetical protein
VATVSELDGRLGRGEDDLGSRAKVAGFVADAEAFRKENRWITVAHAVKFENNVNYEKLVRRTKISIEFLNFLHENEKTVRVRARRG